MVQIDFNELSKHGIIVSVINKHLHELGLALCYDPDTGIANGVLVAEDLIWEYSPEIAKEHGERFENFMYNRESILKEYIQNAANVKPLGNGIKRVKSQTQNDI